MPAVSRLVLDFRLTLRSVLSVAVLAGNVRGLFFELKPGAIDECFKVTPGAGHKLVGSYEADGPTEGVKATVRGVGRTSKNDVMWTSSEASGKFSVEVVEEGPHRLCFDSTVSDIQMVSFNFHVEHGSGVDHKEFVTKEHTDKMSELVAQLESRAADILDQQQYAITREAVHRETAESTNSRVMWWTFVEVFALVALAAFQVYYLKSYFEVKQIV